MTGAGRYTAPVLRRLQKNTLSLLSRRCTILSLNRILGLRCSPRLCSARTLSFPAQPSSASALQWKYDVGERPPRAPYCLIAATAVENSTPVCSAWMNRDKSMQSCFVIKSASTAVLTGLPCHLNVAKLCEKRTTGTS